MTRPRFTAASAVLLLLFALFAIVVQVRLSARGEKTEVFQNTTDYVADAAQSLKELTKKGRRGRGGGRK